MAQINHWWTTRPKRKLVTMVDVFRNFLAVTEGKRWSANRELHRAFEEALEKTELKTEGERRDKWGSGWRTYAAWLFSFGLWFEDSEGLVRPTLAGSDLLKKNPVPILSYQILNFQYPSAFSKKTRVSERFKIMPFRFILSLLMDARLEGHISKTELARFVLTQAETDRDLDKVISLIKAYRYNGAWISDEELSQVYWEVSKLEDTANTFINQLEYTQLIDRTNGEGTLCVRKDKKNFVASILRSEPRFVGRSEESENFQRKYGLGPDHERDNRTFGRSRFVSATDSENTKVLLTLSDFLAYSPITSISTEVLKDISEKTGIELRKVELIISESEFNNVSYEAFEEKYIDISLSGTAYAKEFERSTAGIFGTEGLWFDTKWIGPRPNHPDILAISEGKGEEYCGIIDTKAYHEYSIIGDHRRRMTGVYIPNFKGWSFQSKPIPPLAFFSYIAGGFSSTVDDGIQRIFAETGVWGFGMTASELLLLLRKHRSSPLSKNELKTVFQSNRRILASDFRN